MAPLGEGRSDRDVAVNRDGQMARGPWCPEEEGFTPWSRAASKGVGRSRRIFYFYLRKFFWDWMRN
jgi:hypothetical protein